jgi:LEA14-like dessication related protein
VTAASKSESELPASTNGFLLASTFHDRTTTLSNEVRVPVDVSAINYTVSINGITLADGVSSETYTIDPGETRPITAAIGLDNAKMDTWWVTHVHNGEQSHLSVNATATVSVAGRTETVPLRTLSQTASFTTDLFE